jgi:hypothetical protein
MKGTNLDKDEIYMGYITSGLCTECGKDTFAVDEICFDCKLAMAESDRLYFKPSLGNECE